MAYNQPYSYGYYPQYQNGAVPDMLNQYKGQYQQMPMQQNIPTQQMQMPIFPTSQKSSNELILGARIRGCKGIFSRTK